MVLAIILWYMTWAFIDEFGFVADLYSGTGGSNIALKFMVYGLKLQSCSPDAILAAVAKSPFLNCYEERAELACILRATFVNIGIGWFAD